MFGLEEVLINENARFLLILISTFVFVILSYLILKIIIKKIAGRKKTYGRFILKKLSIPTITIIFFLGLYSSFRSLSIVYDYTIPVGENTYLLLDSIFFVILTLVISVLISRILTVLMMGWLKIRRGFERPPDLLNKTLVVIIYIIAIIVILGYFQIDITPMVAGVGLGALAIGLALQSTLANFFAGVHLISDKPIEVGDYIELDENTKGVVEDIGWRSTRIKTLTDNLLIIPNGKLAESNITNFSKPKQDMALWVPCGVAYESDLKKVETVSLEVAQHIQKTVDGAIEDFEPVFRYREYGDSNINFIVVLRVKEPMKRFSVRNEFIKALKERFDKEKIEISWPIRKIYNIK